MKPGERFQATEMFLILSVLSYASRSHKKTGGLNLSIILRCLKIRRQGLRRRWWVKHLSVVNDLVWISRTHEKARHGPMHL